MTTETYQFWSIVLWALGVVAGVGVLVVYGLQLKAMREGLAETAKAANAAALSANTAHNEFLLSQRPKLIVRKIKISEFIKTHLSGTFDVVNTGGTSATIKDIHAVFFTDPNRTLMIPFDDSIAVGNIRLSLHAEPVLPSGTGGRFDIPIFILAEDQYDSINRQIARGEHSSTRLCVAGYVMYMDNARNERRTSFYRRFDFEKGYFVPINNPDYEHAD